MTVTPLMPVYPRCGVRPVRGEGCFLIGEDGTRYLDFAAGIAVNLLGHSHPHLIDAIQRQAATLMHVSNLYGSPQGERLAQRLEALGQVEGADRHRRRDHRDEHARDLRPPALAPEYHEEAGAADDERRGPVPGVERVVPVPAHPGRGGRRGVPHGHLDAGAGQGLGQQGPLQRAFGVFSVDIQTGAGKKGGEIALPALVPDAVEELRAARPQATSTEPAGDEPWEQRYARRIVRHYAL